MKTAGVYKIVNIITNKIYIGSSIDIRKRWARHKYFLKRNEHHSRYLQNAWNKYGEDAFALEILEECETDRKQLISREQYYIDEFKPAYNHLPNAGSRLGSKASDEVKKKISESLKGKKLGYKRKSRDVTEETKLKISEALTGRQLSEEHKEHLRQVKLGKPLTEEHKHAIATSLGGKPWSDNRMKAQTQKRS